MSEPEPMILDVVIAPCRDIAQNGNVTAIGHMSDHTIVDIVSWYNDEITMHSQDFVGKTRKQAIQMKLDLDVAYLRS